MYAVLPWGGGGWGIPLGSETNFMLGLAVCHERPRRQVFSAVRTLNLQPMVGPVGESPPRHPYLVRLYRLGPDRATGVAEHLKSIPNICMKPHPVE